MQHRPHFYSIALLACALSLTGCPEPEDNNSISPTEDMASPGGDMTGSGGDMSPDTSEDMGCITSGCETTCADVDADGDGVADDCDVCAGHDDAIDADGDGVPDGCDVCVGEDDAVADADSDSICVADDNCPDSANPGQEDNDHDGIGDVCDPNAPPMIMSASISPDPAYRGATLVCAPNDTSDADGDAIMFEYAWSIDTAPLPNETTNTLTTTLAVGDSVTCTITPFDGAEYGDPATSSAIVVQNHLPTISSVALSPTTPDIFSTLTCAPMMASDVEGDDVSLAYKWQINGADINVTTETLTAMDFAKFDLVTCIVTPTDPFGDGASVNSNSVTIINTPPTLSVAQLDLAANGAVEVTSANLDGADSDNLATELIYTLTSAPSQGTLSLAGSALALNDTFTQDDVDNARILYAHSGPATTDAFDVSLCDSDGACTSSGTQTINITATEFETYGNVGQTGTCPSSQSFYGGNFLLGSDPITITQSAELVDFSIFGCGSNAQVRVVLYRFEQNTPTTFVARSVVGTVGQGTQSLALEGGPVMLAPGQYLINIIFDQNNSGVANSPTNTTTWYQAATINSQPGTMTPQTFAGYSSSIWLTVRE